MQQARPTQMELPLDKHNSGLDHVMANKRQHILARCYDKKGNLLSVAFNSYTKSHPLQAYFARKVGHSEHKIYLHAEIAAILKARGKPIYKLSVERYDKSGLPANAQPCAICREAIKAFGIRKVEYT